MSALRKLSVGLSLIGSAIGLGVALSILIHRVLASESFYSQYLRVPIGFFAVGILQPGAYAALLTWAAIRRSDEIRAAVMWGVGLVFLAEGVSAGLAMDEIGVWLLYAGAVSATAAFVSTLEAAHPLRALGLGIIAVVVFAAVVWILDRLAPVTGFNGLGT